VPEPNTGEKLEFRAVFESQESVASTRQEVWNGRIESKAQTLLIVNPKLQTPQDYLWNACPGQALKMMKDDPGLINKKSGDDECTPLHHAARFGHKDVVIWLIEHGAEVNAAAYNGFTPLHLAERKEIAEILIKAGAKLDQKDTWGKTPLQSAAEDRKQEVVEAILDSGYKLDLSTALLLNRRSEAVKMLISDANVIVGGDGGSDLARNATPLGFAAAQGDLPLIKLLLEAGAPINDPTECPPYGGLATPLCNAVWAGKEETVEFLLTHGASTNVVGGKFYISIGEFAEKNSNKKIVDLLTKYGTNARIERPYSQDASKVRNKLPARIASGEFKVPAEMKQDK
jgi:ankyrin repeat protein